MYDIPISNPDPGPDGRVGTADDPATSITYYDYPAGFAGVAFQQPMLINHPSADEHYKSFEMAATKRFSSRWQLMASYSATKLGLNQAVLADFNPNTEINTADHSWEWLTRISGLYRLPADVQLAANYENRSGSALARTVSVRGGRQVPSLTVRVEPTGTIRLPRVAEGLAAAECLQPAECEYRARGDRAVRSKLHETDQHRVAEDCRIRCVVHLLMP